jgi:ABC-type multidrug transport system permease subunit
VFCQELPIFLREHQSGMYRTDVYFLSKTIADLPFFILFPTIFSAVAYFMIGLNESVERFLVCTLIIIIVSNVSCSFGNELLFFFVLYRFILDRCGFCFFFFIFA